MKQVPFYANTDDNTHCVQACFRMILKYWLPERDFSWAELDRLTRKVKDKGTWWFAILPQLQKIGLRIKVIERFDYQKFYDEGNNYVLGFFGPEIGRWHLEETNLAEVRHLIPVFLGQVEHETRSASFKDLDQLLEAGWLVMIDVNSRTLNDRHGFSGHVIVVYQKQGQSYMVNDPGLPAHKQQKVSRSLLQRAWEFAGKDNKALVAIKGKQ